MDAKKEKKLNFLFSVIGVFGGKCFRL